MVYISDSMQPLVSLDVRAMQLQRGVSNFTQRNTRRDNSVGQDTVAKLNNYDSDIKSLSSSINSITLFTNRLEQSRDVWDTVGKKLNRMHEIVYYAHDTLGSIDTTGFTTEQLEELQLEKDNLQLEINQILMDIRTVVKEDTYQGTSLLGGNYDYKTRVGLESNNYFDVDFKGAELAANVKKTYTGGGPDIIKGSSLGANLVTTNSFVISSAPKADNIESDGTDSNIATEDGRIYLYNRENSSPVTTLALTADDQKDNSYVNLELGYRMDAYESNGTAYIIASTADNTDYIAKGGRYKNGVYVNGDPLYDQYDKQNGALGQKQNSDPATHEEVSDGKHRQFMYYHQETNKIDPDGLDNLYTADELKAGSDYQLFTTNGSTYHMGGVAQTDEYGDVVLKYSTADLDAASGGKIQVKDIYGDVLKYSVEMLNGTNVLNDGTGTSGKETSALYGTRIAKTENDGTTVITYKAPEFTGTLEGQDTYDIDRIYLKKNDGIERFKYTSDVFASEVAAGDTEIAELQGYDTDHDGIVDVSYNRSFVLDQATTSALTFTGGETVRNEYGEAVTYTDYLRDSLDSGNKYDVDEADVDLSRQVNAGNDSSSDYFGQNLISTKTDSNFSGALTAGEKVDILDIDGKVIHTFSGDEDGNDVVMEVHGASSYVFKDDIPSPSVDTANIDFSRVANAGGDSGSTYYDKNIISTVADSNFSGALDAGVIVEVLDSSNNIIHRFSGDEVGNDLVMEVNGGNSYNVVSTNTPNTPDTGDIDYSRKANAAGDTGSSYYGQNVISTVADSNFSGALASGETVQVLDASNNVIHEFEGGVAGNDVVMQVEGVASYNIGNSNAIADPDSGNIDFSREANAAGDTGSVYYGENRIGTVADTNFSGPLDSGITVQVLDASNNVIHEFEGGVAGNDVVMEVEGAVSYNIENNNSVTSASVGDIDLSRSLNAGGDVGSLYFEMERMSDDIQTQYGNAGVLEVGEELKVYDDSNNLMHVFSATETVYAIAGASWVEYTNDTADTTINSNEIDLSKTVNAGGDTGSAYYNQNLISNIKVKDVDGNDVKVALGFTVEMQDSDGNVIHKFNEGEQIFEVEGAVKMLHFVGEELKHNAGDKKYHKVGDDQYVKEGDTKYHFADDVVYQKDGDILYHDVGDNETHKIGEQMFFEVDTDVNGALSHGGSAYVYRTNGNNTERVELLAPNSVKDGDKFGEQVAIAGDKAFVYSQGDQKVYVYDGVDSATGTLAHSDSIDVSGLNITSLTAFNDGSEVYLGVGSSNGKGSVSIYKGSNNFDTAHLTLKGEKNGDEFGSAIAFNKHNNGSLEVAISATQSNDGKGKLYLYFLEDFTNDEVTFYAGNELRNMPGDHTIQYLNTKNVGREITITDEYISAIDDNETVTVWERETGDMQYQNSSSNIGGISIEDENLYLADSNFENVIELDLTTTSKFHLLDPTLSFDNAGYGLSSFLENAIDTISVSTEVHPLVNRDENGTLKKSDFNSAARDVNGLDLINMDTVLKNFNVMNSKYEATISRLKSEINDLIEEKDKIMGVETDNTQLVSNVLDTVYGDSGINNIMNIMNPFDLTLVSSLMP